MFNLLLALITGLVMGWSFHSFFMQLNPPNIFKEISDEKIMPILSPVNIEKKVTIEELKKNIGITKERLHLNLNKEANISIIKPKEILDSKTSDNFYELLNNDHFSEAMTLYVDASTMKLLLYQVTLLEYFDKKSNEEPAKAVEQMLEFQELEHYDTKISLEILHEIEDNNYKEKAQILLQLIKEKIDKKTEYLHQIPLKKVGDHFTIEVSINNESFTLLLDTGATLTMVNENKISLLHIIKENITLNTAGGIITAQLQEADIFSVGEIKLENFQIVTSSFEQKNADGLLGMNFFKQFKFKIDQEKAILYLSKKITKTTTSNYL